MMRAFLILLANLLLTATVIAADDPEAARLKLAGIAVDGPGLLAFLQKHSTADADPSELPKLIDQLGSAEFAERQRAAKTLVAMGSVASTDLWKATKHPDKEIANLARNCIDQIGRGGELHPAVIRQLMKIKPKGSLETLLRYLPFAASEDAREEVWYAIDELAGPAGSLNQGLIAALTDRSPARRALAGCIVARKGTPDQRAAAHKLFTDKDPEVRLRAAQGTLAARDASAIPVLIPLLEAEPIDLAWQAEELLHWAAGKDEKKPKVCIGAGTPELRKQCLASWSAWSQATPNLSLKDRGRSRPGIFLVACYVYTRAAVPHRIYSTVRLYGCDGEVRWESPELSPVFEAHILRGGRLLLAQSPERRWADGHWTDGPTVGVTERDLTGKVLWQFKPCRHPQWCRRLSNGHTLMPSGTVSGAMSIVEATPDGEIVRAHDYDHKPVLNGANLQPTPRDTLLTQINRPEGCTLVEFEIAPPETARVVVTTRLPKPFTGSLPYLVTVPPDGPYLVSAPDINRLFAVTPGADVLREYRMRLGRTSRLRGGTMLAGVDNRFFELDSEGHTLWSVTLPLGTAQTVAPQAQPSFKLIRFGFSHKESD